MKGEHAGRDGAETSVHVKQGWVQRLRVHPVWSIMLMVTPLLLWSGPSFGAEGDDASNEVLRLRRDVNELREQVKALLQLQAAQAAQTASTNSAALAGSAAPASKEDLAGVRSDVQTLRDQLNRSIDSTINPNNNMLVTATRSVGLYSTIQIQDTVSDNPYNYSAKNTVAGGKAVPGDTATAQGVKLNNLILGVQGRLYHDYDEGQNVFYNFSLSASNPNANNYNIAPLDAYLGFNILPTVNPEEPQLNLQVGQQQKQFGTEATAGEAYITTINRANFVAPLGLGRDAGALFNGTLFVHDDYGANWAVPLIQYWAGAFNGTGQNTLDYSGGRLAPNARVVLNAPVDYSSPLRGLSIGASYYGGYTTNYETSVHRTDVNKADRSGLDVSWVHSPYGLTAELVHGHDDLFTATKKVPVDEVGYVLTAFYQWGEKFEQDFQNQDRNNDWFPQTYQPFIRFESYDDGNHDVATDLSIANRQQIETLGFNWFFAKTTKLQLNLRHVDNSLTNPHSENQAIAQFQYGF